MKKIRLIIFAKAPLPGFAKTRLIPALGEAGAARLAQHLMLTTIENGLKANVGLTELCVTPEPSNAVWSTFPIPTEVKWSAQSGGDLGERLAKASKCAIENGESPLLIGTDCPQLSPDILRNAAKSLQDFDAVIIPATDGGYTLLGFNKFDSSIFENISWSTDSVFVKTVCHMTALNWRIAKLDSLHDIDEPSDLRWLPDNWPEKTTLFK